VPFSDIRLGTHRRDLLAKLIPRVGLIIFWGPPKCGKSFLVFDMAMHVAMGREYRGRRVHQGPVVYCAFEGQTGIEARVEAFRQKFMAEDGDAPPFYLEPVTLNLVGEHQALIDVIRRQLPEGRPVAVVLDTLNRSMQGSESNDEDMSNYVKAADAIREAFGCAVIVVHHCGIEGTRPRGHTSLTGAADAQLAVRRDGADNIVVAVEFATVLALLLFATFLAHLAAALMHALIFRDDVFGSMSGGSERAAKNGVRPTPPAAS
jgi:RecA-family ATPase